jgi:integrase
VLRTLVLDFALVFAYPCLPDAYPIAPLVSAAMSQQKLTKLAVEQIPAQGAEVVVWDTALPGFGLRVKPTGVRSYIIQYRDRTTGASKRMTIGQHGALLTFDQAKKHARGILADALRGQDPVGERWAGRKAPNMADLASDYLERHAVPKKRPKSVRDDRAMLENVILPAVGTKKVASIKRRDIESMHLRLNDRPYQANRLLALISKMLNLAVEWGWRRDNPANGIQRYREESRLVRVLEKHPNIRAANVVRLQLLTGARMGEVLKAERKDFDLDRGVWTKPSHHTKQKQREHVPLSRPTQDLVSSIVVRTEPDSPYLFPGNIPGEPLQDIKKFWSMVMREADIENYRRHDNRHTFASHLVSSGLSLEIVGRLLGHTNPTTTQRYAHLADDPLRLATARFSDKIAIVSAQAARDRSS